MTLRSALMFFKRITKFTKTYGLLHKTTKCPKSEVLGKHYHFFKTDSFFAAELMGSETFLDYTRLHIGKLHALKN